MKPQSRFHSDEKKSGRAGRRGKGKQGKRKAMSSKALIGHKGAVASLEFSPDGKFLASGCNNIAILVAAALY